MRDERGQRGAVNFEAIQSFVGELASGGNSPHALAGLFNEAKDRPEVVSDALRRAGQDPMMWLLGDRLEEATAAARIVSVICERDHRNMREYAESRLTTILQCLVDALDRREICTLSFACARVHDGYGVVW
jgi:hypothetical protein